MKKTNHIKLHLFLFGKSAFWFAVGNVLGLFFFVSFIFFFFQHIYGNVIYPGVYIGNIYVGGKGEKEVEKLFDKKNAAIAQSTFSFVYNDDIATISAKDIHVGYNSALLAQQAYTIGRSNYTLSNVTLIFNAYLNGIFLSPSYTLSHDQLVLLLTPIIQKTNVAPVDALFSFENGKVSSFRPSSNGQEVDIDTLTKIIVAKIPSMLLGEKAQATSIPIPIKIVKPAVSTDDVNNLGIRELIGSGTSLFQHSIPGRIFNVTLAATRLNGILIAPNQLFSFDKALGDVSAFTGYQQAYVIQDGKTVLGDGGGVCQVSTTMFRAILNAGLPIIERHAHAYRVGYYEEDSPPGIDATVYVPSVDLKFRNDTGHYILVQTIIDPTSLRLTFNLYGTSDTRKAIITTPVITNQTPPPQPLYTDDPTLPKGAIKQVDFSAWGAHVSFNRTVIKNDKIIIADTFISDYQPWQAAYLRGTKD
jgi:vancomycin resistance protein YoaR